MAFVPAVVTLRLLLAASLATMASCSVVNGSVVISRSTAELFAGMPFRIDTSRLNHTALDEILGPLLEGPGRLSLHALRQGEELSKARLCLGSCGFCWLELDDELASLAAPARSAAEAFLAGLGKGTGSREALVGHVSTDHKDPVRLVTGELAGGVALPAAVAEPLLVLARALDDAQLDLAKALVPQSDWEGAALLSGSPRYGLLDVVRYRNEAGTPPVAVEPHADPGLLLLGLPSDQGLEFWGEAGRWVSPPPGLGVLWAGQALGASRPAVHRVVAGSAPRLAMWHELCTRSQLAPPVLEDLARRGMGLAMPGVRGTEAVLRALRDGEDHRPLPRADGEALPMGLALSKQSRIWSEPLPEEKGSEEL